MYWDAVSKSYIPVPGGNSAETQPAAMTAEDQAILSNPAADAPLEMKKPLVPPLNAAGLAPVPGSAASSASETVPTSTAALEKKDDDDSAKKDKDNKDDKPRSLAAVKVALQLQYQCTKCKYRCEMRRWLRNVFLFADHERYGALGKDPESSKGKRPCRFTGAEDGR